ESLAARGACGGRRLRTQPGDQVHRPPAPARAAGAAAAHPHRVPAVVSQRPRHHLVCRCPGVQPRDPRGSSVPGSNGVCRQPALPGGPLPQRRTGRRGAGVGAGRSVAAVKVGIVGLPNAGKSSLFTALTGVAAEAANYPFTTIEPNVAVVPMADPRLDAVAGTVGASNIVPDTITFHDIAGLVAGAHRGEG